MSIFIDKHELAERKDIVNPNLFTGSKDFTGKWTHIPKNAQKDKYLDFTAIYVNWAWLGISQYIAVNKGETFTASMYVKAEAGSKLFWYTLLWNDKSAYKAAQVSRKHKTINGTGNWQKTSFTFTITDDGAIIPRIESDGSSPFWIAGMKLEKGAIATPWCPAYEDYAMKSDLDAPKAEIANNENDSMELATQEHIDQATKSKLNSLDSRVSALESSLQDIQSSIQSIQSSLQSSQSSLQSSQSNYPSY